MGSNIKSFTFNFQLNNNITRPLKRPNRFSFHVLLGTSSAAGGMCNFDECPAISPENLCPLERSLRFMTVEECEAWRTEE